MAATKQTQTKLKMFSGDRSSSEVDDWRSMEFIRKSIELPMGTYRPGSFFSLSFSFDLPRSHSQRS